MLLPLDHPPSAPLLSSPPLTTTTTTILHSSSVMLLSCVHPFSTKHPKSLPTSPTTTSFPPHISCKASLPATPISTSATTTIQSLCRKGHIEEALHHLSLDTNPSQAAYAALILACTHRNAVSLAEDLRRMISRNGFDRDSFICTKLVDMYSEFGDVDSARKVFDGMPVKSIFMWNSFLRALALAGEGVEALAMCRKMGRSRVALDRFTYSFVLKACVNPSSRNSLALRRVQEIHCHILRHGFERVVHVATTLVDVYSKLCQVGSAKKVFDGMPERNVVTWSAMIACYANSEMPFEALELFGELMVDFGDVVLPNAVTMVSVLKACAGLSALEQGNLVHAYVIRRGLDLVVPVRNALIALYMKCGRLDVGRQIFNTMGNRRDVVSWNSMISGLGIHGLGVEAVHLFLEMIQSRIKPNSISFVSVLGACSHAGLVQEGKEFFDSMAHVHGIIPSAEHYACMVDILGRAGHLDEASKIVAEMRTEPGPTVWGSLLGACRTHGNVELAERACRHLFELEPTNAGNYVLLANIYADTNMFEQVDMVKQLLEDKNLQKMPGCSWIEVKRKLYSFASADEMNPQVEQLNAFLVQLVTEMKSKGYVPQTKVVLYDLGQDEKEHILLGHSEKLAVAFGLINSSNREVIRITKNLRLCEDCHSLTKYISKFTKREIFVRDVNRFHHFKDGACSCRDYW